MKRFPKRKTILAPPLFIVACGELQVAFACGKLQVVSLAFEIGFRAHLAAMPTEEFNLKSKILKSKIKAVLPRWKKTRESIAVLSVRL